jgi:hypothetical protein
MHLAYWLLVYASFPIHHKLTGLRFHPRKTVLEGRERYSQCHSNLALYQSREQADTSSDEQKAGDQNPCAPILQYFPVAYLPLHSRSCATSRQGQSRRVAMHTRDHSRLGFQKVQTLPNKCAQHRRHHDDQTRQTLTTICRDCCELPLWVQARLCRGTRRS